MKAVYHWGSRITPVGIHENEKMEINPDKYRKLGSIAMEGMQAIEIDKNTIFIAHINDIDQHGSGGVGVKYSYAMEDNSWLEENLKSTK